jgi:hypothetical protein
MNAVLKTRTLFKKTAFIYFSNSVLCLLPVEILRDCDFNFVPRNRVNSLQKSSNCNQGSLIFDYFFFSLFIFSHVKERNADLWVVIL